LWKGGGEEKREEEGEWKSPGKRMVEYLMAFVQGNLFEKNYFFLLCGD
jgi:hypothetical protein